MRFDYRRRYALLLLFSVLLHLLLIWWLSDSRLFELDRSSKKPIHISLQHRQKAAPEPSEPESIKVPEPDQIIEPPKVEPEPAKPKDQEKPTEFDPSLLIESYKTGDEFSSNNQTDETQTQIDYGMNQNTERAKTKASKEQIKETKGVVTTRSQSTQKADGGAKTGETVQEPETKLIEDVQETAGEDDEVSEAKGEKAETVEVQEEIVVDKELEIPPELLNNLGNMKVLSDIDLQEAVVKDPFSKRQSAEVKLVNQYFKIITEQILQHWINPLTPRERKQKLDFSIEFEIDSNGRLVNSKVHLQSGHDVLDQSILKAIRSVPRFDTSFDKSIREKYRVLFLTPSTDGLEYELMPFEKKEN